MSEEPYLDPRVEIDAALEVNPSAKEKLRAVLTIAYRLSTEKKQWHNLAAKLKETLDTVKSKQEVSCGWCGEVFGVVERTDGEEKLKAYTKVAEHAKTCSMHPFNEKMDCGHPKRYLYKLSENKEYCLLCVLDGDLESRVIQETRLMWRASAVKYAKKLEAKIAEMETNHASELEKIMDAENERADFLRSTVGTSSLEHFIVRFKEMQAESTRLRKSLEEYANTENWVSGYNPSGNPTGFHDLWLAEDGYIIAEAALRGSKP